MAFVRRNKQDVKSKKSIIHGARKDGKPKKIGVKVKFTDGESVTLLNPSGKGEKYARELKENRRVTNDGTVKVDENGKQIPLTKEQRAYRAAYLTAQSDNAKAYKARKAKRNGKK